MPLAYAGVGTQKTMQERAYDKDVEAQGSEAGRGLRRAKKVASHTADTRIIQTANSQGLTECVCSAWGGAINPAFYGLGGANHLRPGRYLWTSRLHALWPAGPLALAQDQERETRT